MKKTIAVLFAVSMIACNVNYEKTPSGLAYKIFHGKGTVVAKTGEFAKFNLAYILKDRDSVLSSTYGKIPAYSPIDSGKDARYSFMEVLPMMKEGDSAEISINIDSLKSKKIVEDYSPLLVKGQIINCKIQLLKVFKNEQDMLADYQKAIDNEKQAETKQLEDYMQKKNLKGIKTTNGAYVIIENPGDTSKKAEDGKLASIMYRGYLLNGKVFDTNMDTSKGHPVQPMQVPVGMRNGLIPGFSEGLPYFGKGGKGKILIPAFLGYGTQSTPDIPAFSNLVFDIEITDVQDMPKMPAGSMSDGSMPPSNEQSGKQPQK